MNTLEATPAKKQHWRWIEDGRFSPEAGFITLMLSPFLTAGLVTFMEYQDQVLDFIARLWPG